MEFILKSQFGKETWCLFCGLKVNPAACEYDFVSEATGIRDKH